MKNNKICKTIIEATTVLNALITFLIPYLILGISFPFGDIGDFVSISESLGIFFLVCLMAVFFVIPFLTACCAVFNEIVWTILILLKIEKERNPRHSETFDFALRAVLVGGAVAGTVFILLVGIGFFLS